MWVWVFGVDSYPTHIVEVASEGVQIEENISDFRILQIIPQRKSAGCEKVC